MKFVIVFAALVAVCVAAPADSDVAATALRDSRQNGPENYQFDFETSNGISRQETGELKHVDNENSAIVVSGSVSWTSPEGTLVELKYTADENGYHPVV